jgi:hypothetical protein
VPLAASPDRQTALSQRHTTAVLLLAVVVGLAGGALTAYAQGWLPARASSLANSAGAWALVAFAVALLPRRLGSATTAAALALFGLVLGYYATNELRGNPASLRTVELWMFAAVTVGPLLGAAAWWVRHGRPGQAAGGAGAISGLLIGEGVYGLRVIGDTTYPPYWRGEIAVGAVLLALIIVVQLRSLRGAAQAVAWAAPVAAVVAVLLGADPLAS